MATLGNSSLAQPVGAFRFIVEVGSKPLGAFTECTLPSIELDVEEVKEGGLNTSVHLIPGPRKAARITLKNGVAKSPLMDWYLAILGRRSGKLERKTLTIRLMNNQKQTVMSWDIQDAYPLKWSGPELKSDSTAVAVQSLEIACGEITIHIF